MMSEESELVVSKLKLLRTLDRDNVAGQIEILLECVELQAKEIASLRQYQEDVDEVLENMEKEGC